MVDYLWFKSYNDLAKNRPEFYQAVVRKHHWEGFFIFQAIPHSGSSCIECKSKDQAELLRKAEQWFSGEMPEDFYSASF